MDHRASVRTALFLLAATALSIAPGAAAPLAPYSGGITGRSGKNGQDCSSCHSGGSAPTVTLTGPAFLLHDSTRTFTFRVAGGQQVAAGLNVALDVGTLVATDSETYTSNEELTHANPRPVDSNGEVAWSFDVVAPSAAGPLTLWAAGNSVDLSGDQTGDLPGLTQLQVTVVDSLTSFAEFGSGLAGSGGFLPHLAGIDGPSSGPWSIELTDGLGGAPAYLFASTATTTFPLFGGTFYVDLSLPFLLLPLALDGTPGAAGDGSLSLDGEDYSAFAPLTIFAQAAVIDLAAPRKVALSNALRMDVEN